MSTLSPYHSIYTGAEVDELLGKAGTAKTRLDKIYDGTWDLSSGVDSGSVIGLGLNFTPVRAILQVEIPAAGVLMFAVPIRDSLSADGFSFQLSGLTDSINYRLHYILIGEVLFGSSGATDSGSESGDSSSSS